MGFLPRFQRASAASLLRLYVVAGALALFVGFAAYGRWMQGRLEDRNRAFVEPLAKLYSYVPEIDDKDTSERVAAAIRSFYSGTGLRLVIVDAAGEPILARGVDPELARRLDAQEPLDAEQREALQELLERLRSRPKSRIPIEYPPEYQPRDIIGRLYYGDVDPELLAKIPLALADVDGNPVAWRIYGGWETPASHPEGAGRASAFIRDAERSNRVHDLQINPRLAEGAFYYELSPFRALDWMPYVQTVLGLLFALGGWLLYRQVRSQERSAVWAGLAKEGAHQLGSPISSLMGWVDLAESRGGGLSAEIRSEMRRDLERLRQVTFRFSEIGSPPRLRAVDAVAAARSAASYFRERLPRIGGGAQIAERYGSVPPVWANETLLRWALENLIRNAADAIASGPSREEGGVIEIAADLANRKNHVMIKVTDNGGGVARSDRRRIFKPGFTTKVGGWGIGLALTRRIVEGPFGGRIALTKTGPGGSEFRMELPTAEEASGD